ncbi:putative reverse transcriptase domain-containing protein [Tanacetum coccineum]
MGPPTATLQKAECRQSLQHGDGRKEALWGIPAKVITSNANVVNPQKGNGITPKGNGCFECGAPGYFKRDYPKLKNKNRGNGNAQGWVLCIGSRKEGNAP